MYAATTSQMQQPANLLKVTALAAGNIDKSSHFAALTLALNWSRKGHRREACHALWFRRHSSLAAFKQVQVVAASRSHVRRGFAPAMSTRDEHTRWARDSRLSIVRTHSTPLSVSVWNRKI
jgi:hypothetical protein